jgi:hypothetical protein
MRRFVCSIALGVLLQAGACAVDATAPADVVFGVWRIDPALTSPYPGEASAKSGHDAQRSNPSHQYGGRHGDASGTGMGGGGMQGGTRRHGGGNHSGAPSAHRSTDEDDTEQRELGLVRVFAQQMTITALSQRIRFEAGDHVVELDKDGTNVSGPGVGGTVALTAMKPDLVVETLTDSGYSLSEHYHLGDDGKHLQLHVSLKKPGADPPREFVRVFDRMDAAANLKGSAPAASPQR